MPDPDETPGRRARTPRRNPVDDMIEETFPASDAPGWGPLHIGAPGEHPEPHDAAPPPSDAPEPDAGP